MQLTLTLSTPSANQEMPKSDSAKLLSLVRVGGVIQSSRCARSIQYSWLSAIDRA